AEMRAGESVISTCRSCGGAWLDAATVNRLKTARDHEIDLAAQRIAARVLTGAAPDRDLPISCPVCRNHLQRVSIAGAPWCVDVCDAHGTWFDRAEAHELQLFVDAFEAIRMGHAPGGGDGRPGAAKGGFFSRLFGSGG